MSRSEIIYFFKTKNQSPTEEPTASKYPESINLAPDQPTPSGGTSTGGSEVCIFKQQASERGVDNQSPNESELNFEPSPNTIVDALTNFD